MHKGRHAGKQLCICRLAEALGNQPGLQFAESNGAALTRYESPLTSYEKRSLETLRLTRPVLADKGYYLSKLESLPL